MEGDWNVWAREFISVLGYSSFTRVGFMYSRTLSILGNACLVLLGRITWVYRT